MALSQNQIKAMADGIVEIMRALDSGTATAQELRNRARALPGGQGVCLLGWIDVAEMFHQCPSVEKPEATVRNPRYRKGTAMQPTTWDMCLWRPTP